MRICKAVESRLINRGDVADGSSFVRRDALLARRRRQASVRKEI